MKITGVITLYTSNANSPQFQATVAQLMAMGKFVILKPLSEIKQRKRQQPTISSDLTNSLATMAQN